MGVAVFGSIAVAIFSYFKHRSTAALTERAAGSGNAPCKWLLKWDHQASIDWAASVLSQPDEIAIIDITESGPNPRDEVIEIAVLDGNGSALFHSLVKPVTQRINPKFALAHGLQDKDLESAPSFAEIAPRLFEALKGRQWIFYQKEFIERILKQTCTRYDIDLPGIESTELRHYLAAYEGEWSPYEGSYRLPSLPGSDCRAQGDCWIMLDQIRRMAADSTLVD